MEEFKLEKQEALDGNLENSTSLLAARPSKNVNPFPNEMQPEVAASLNFENFINYEYEKCCGEFPDRKPC